MAAPGPDPEFVAAQRCVRCRGEPDSGRDKANAAALDPRGRCVPARGRLGAAAVCAPCRSAQDGKRYEHTAIGWQTAQIPANGIDV
jgi:hypothetical protein